MQLLKTTFSIVAPSKRCCPICANLIAYLSQEEGAPILHTLTKHSYIFPTAFPCGLPKSIRHKLILEYKQRLFAALNDLVSAARTSSGLSLQSQAASIDSGDEGDEALKLEEAIDDNTKRWVTAWIQEPEPQRSDTWERLEASNPVEWARCRMEVCSQKEALWEGYKVPGYVLDSEAVPA